MNKKSKVFDEQALRKEIEEHWGAHGAHAEVYNDLLRRIEECTPDSCGACENGPIVCHQISPCCAKYHPRKKGGT